MPIIRGGAQHRLGTTVLNKTGGWRTFKPVINHDLCNRCKICSDFCVDGIVYRVKGEPIVIDYDYCKGCGICANECPLNAIEMVREEV